MSERIYNIIQNYIYFYHTNQFLVIPVYPESVQDSLQVQFNPTTPLARSAPIYSYASSGPRSVSFQFSLHRDLMKQTNYAVSNMIPKDGDDYIDTFCKAIQAATLPKYVDASKMVNPPLVAIRLGDSIFCKGVIQGQVSVDYKPPIVTTKDGKNKYSVMDIQFGVYETQAFDATTIQAEGSMRGLSLDTTLQRRIESLSGTTSALEVI